MANYECKIRTNYFHVKDGGQFKKFMKNVCGSEDKIEVWEKKMQRIELYLALAVTGKLPDSEILMGKLTIPHMTISPRGFKNILRTMTQL